MAVAKLDENSRPTLTAVSSVDGTTIVRLYADPVTHRLLVDLPAAPSLNTEIPTGTVDGSNVTFTFTNTPKIIVVDQSRIMMQNHGWTLAGLVATLDIAPTFEIYSQY